jgi:hypothetical protein
MFFVALTETIPSLQRGIDTANAKLDVLTGMVQILVNAITINQAPNLSSPPTHVTPLQELAAFWEYERIVKSNFEERQILVIRITRMF